AWGTWPTSWPWPSCSTSPSWRARPSTSASPPTRSPRPRKRSPASCAPTWSPPDPRPARSCTDPGPGCARLHASTRHSRAGSPVVTDRRRNDAEGAPDMAAVKSPLSDSDLKVVGEALQGALIDLIDLSLVAKQAHWNLTGRNFKVVHEHLD